MTEICQSIRMQRRTRKAARLTELLLAISHIRPLLEQLDQRLASEAELTAAGWQVLSALGADKATVPELAGRLGRRRQTVQVAVDVLMESNHVRKESNPHHARSPNIVATPHGLRAFWDTVGRHVIWTNAVAVRFDEADLDTAVHLIQRLDHQLAAEFER
jgi:DNA-binding MarR family transcriptional regulator